MLKIEMTPAAKPNVFRGRTRCFVGEGGREYVQFDLTFTEQTDVTHVIRTPKTGIDKAKVRAAIEAKYNEAFAQIKRDTEAKALLNPILDELYPETEEA